MKKISILGSLRHIKSAFNRIRHEGLLFSIDYYQAKYFGRHADKFRFAMVGSVNTLIDFGILIGLVTLGMDPILANIFSTSVAFVFSFFANKNFTFKSRGGNLGKQFLLFMVVTLFGLWGLQSIALEFTTHTLSSVLADKSTIVILSKIIASVISLIWNYVMYSKVVFKK